MSGSLFSAQARTAESLSTEENQAAETCPDRTGRRSMAYRGFIGGMMLHTGFVCSNDVTVTSLSGASQKVSLSGAPFGIGGAIRFMFGKHLRVGAEGYVSTLTYGEYQSHAETGWGGILADCAWEIGKCRLFVGGTVGGGSQTNTTILSPIVDDYIAEENIVEIPGVPFASVRGEVTTFSFAVSNASGAYSEYTGEDNYLIVRSIQGRVNKITDSRGTFTIYFDYAGPNISMPAF